MKPTVHDIAKEAGVSLATVDRVLNNRSGVRKLTREKVQKAILAIGYIRDISAANLARRRVYRFAFLLPDGQNQFVGTIRDALGELNSAQISDRTQIELFSIPVYDPHAIARELENIAAVSFDGVAIMAPETPQVRDAIAKLKAKNIAVVSMISDQPNSERDHFVGINNIAAGRTAGVLMGRFMNRQAVKIQVITNSMLARDSLERRLGFDAIMCEQFPLINVLPTLETHGDAARTEHIIARAAQVHPDIGAVYLLVSANRALVEALRVSGLMANCTIIGHELTPTMRKALVNGEIDAVITQNVGHLVRSAMRVLRAKCDGLEINHSQERIRIEIVLRENLP